MKETLKKYFPLIILLFFLIQLFLNFDNIFDWIYFSFNLCFYNLFPYLYPFMILSSILMEYGFNTIASTLLNPLMKLFKIDPICSQVLLLSMLSGCPSNAKYIKQLYDKNYINEYTIQKALTFTHFVNPIFILSTIGITFFNSFKYGLIVLISHYSGNFINGFIHRNYYKNKINSNNINNNTIITSNNFINIVVNSIISTTNTLLIILGVISLTNIAINIIVNLFNISNYSGILLSSFLEITQGLNSINNLNITNLNKVMFFSFFLSFGGFSIHAQVMSILNENKIKYLPYLIARLSHSIVSLIISFILYKLC